MIFGNHRNHFKGEFRDISVTILLDFGHLQTEKSRIRKFWESTLNMVHLTYAEPLRLKFGKGLKIF